MGNIVWQVMQSMIQTILRLSSVFFFFLLLFFFQQQVDTSKSIEHKTIDFSYPFPLDLPSPCESALAHKNSTVEHSHSFG